MEGIPEPGEVILFAFPYTDLTATKVRPALVLQTLRRQDMITCQISSKPYADPHAVVLAPDAFATGGLRHVSYVQAAKLFTANLTVVRQSLGRVRTEVLARVIDQVVRVIRGAQP